MKKLVTFLGLTFFFFQSFAQISVDSLNEKVGEQNGRINALEESSAAMQSDLGKLTKIKVSGYIQAQYENYETDLVKKTGDPFDVFFIRRARVKFTYEALEGVQFVLQPDFSTNNLSLKDAYVVVNDPWLNIFSLWAGQFNRLNYEVEYSSTQREVLERSRVIRSIYPGEREIGLKLEIAPQKIPLKFQIAMLNGNFTGKEAKDSDGKKDIMARLIYSVNLSSLGIGIDLGGHFYNGGIRQNSTKYFSDIDSKIDSTSQFDYLKKQWFGLEAQMYFDILGGMSLKGEYINGVNSSIGDSQKNPYKSREFSGFYAYFIKNIGTKHQLVARYDFFDPNTKTASEEASSEVFYKTWTFAWQYYFNDFIRISFNYEMPQNETNSKNKDLKDNVFGIRLQAKF